MTRILIAVLIVMMVGCVHRPPSNEATWKISDKYISCNLPDGLSEKEVRELCGF